ncbi:MAG: ThiF family adenylyltransferase [Nautiliaceae bacterium]
MYSRQIEVIGKENQEILSQKSVLVVGAGGLGNIIVTTISCIGLKKIYIIDFDEIEIHNIHRQFQFCEGDCGKSKSVTLSEKLNKRCKDTEIIGINKKFDSSLELDVDLVFDATDNFEVRREIDKFAKIRSIPWIYASVEEFRGQVGVFKNTSFEIFATKEHNVKGQIPMMVNLIGSISSMLGLKVLIGNQKEVFYFVDFKEDLEIKKFRF